MSQIKTFFVGSGDAAAEEEANAFLRGHRVLRVDRAWAGDGWAMLVEWLDGASGDGARGAASGGRWGERKVDYRAVLDAETFERFARLREVRKAIAKEEAVPPYVVMTDAQMAEAAKPAGVSMAAVRESPGWGEGRAAKYGARMVEALRGEDGASAPAAEGGG